MIGFDEVDIQTKPEISRKIERKRLISVRLDPGSVTIVRTTLHTQLGSRNHDTGAVTFMVHWTSPITCALQRGVTRFIILYLLSPTAIVVNRGRSQYETWNMSCD